MNDEEKLNLENARQKVADAQKRFCEALHAFLNTYGRGSQKRSNKLSSALRVFKEAMTELYKLEHPNPQQKLLL